mmetsp:Transcript_2213/g.2770  ORF Transcript_2213/g.2770 Transcript_2213/m.2770 type:complete len:99 (-) Transcript_2213:112-408(-)
MDMYIGHVLLKNRIESGRLLPVSMDSDNSRPIPGSDEFHLILDVMLRYCSYLLVFLPSTLRWRNSEKETMCVDKSLHSFSIHYLSGFICANRGLVLVA